MSDFVRCHASQARRTHFHFALWAILHDQPPSISEIMGRFGVSYETARHWRIDWIDARITAARAPMGYDHAHD